ncbi:MAG: hypothetical protein KKH44_10220 [Bacteroidetes bacterium]|nr:hypothetical protein [Bacteroidota bacterium]
MIKKLIFPVFYCLIFLSVSCGNRVDNIRVNGIAPMPDEIEGCACYLSIADSSFNKGNFIFAASTDSVAYMRINEELVTLKRTSNTQYQFVFNEKSIVESYTNDEYNVSITALFEDSTSYQSWKFNGALIVKSKTGNIKKMKFVGGCGC